MGIEAAHRTELVARGGLRALNHRRKTSPYRKVARLQKKTVKTRARAAYQQALHDNPKLQSNVFSRMWQKHRLKREYAKAARTARRTGQAAGENGRCHEKSRRRGWAFCQPPPGPLPDGGAPVFDRLS